MGADVEEEALERIKLIQVVNTMKGGTKKVYRFGRRGGTGFGFRGGSPPWPYVGRGRGGFPRCWYPGLSTANYLPTEPHFVGMTREKEADWLNSQAEAVRAELNRVESRIRDLEANK